MGPCDDNIHMTRSRVYMGENVRSLRHLLRRVNLVDVTTIVSPNTGLTTWTFPKYPPWYGYDPNGISTARNVGGTANVPFNWSHNTPYSVLAPCFIAQRGSVHWHLAPKSSQPLSHIALARTAPASVLSNILRGEFRCSQWRCGSAPNVAASMVYFSRCSGYDRLSTASAEHFNTQLHWFQVSSR